MRKVLTVIWAGLFVLSASWTCFAQDADAVKVDLNKATKEQLISLGMDEEMADAVLEHRKENGAFVDLDELLDVEGMNPKLLRQLKKKLFIEEAAGCNC